MMILPFILLQLGTAIGQAIAQATRSPDDLSFFTKGAAIGDSYAAGLGAGNRLGFWCSRYDGSYAYLVASQLGTSFDALDFTYTACTGAVISDVHKQAEKLSAGQEFIIVSAGGNDAGLFDILNGCVYTFYGLFAPGCVQQLAESKTKIESPEMASKLDGLLDVVKSKLTSDGNVFYVGYAKFFDATDNSCDTVSWHMWLNLYSRQYLTKDRRNAMNAAVDSMNEALRRAVERAGSQVHFVDYDSYVEMIGGRFCQPGQDESGGKGANLQDLFFYQMESSESLSEGPHYHEDLKRRQSDELVTNEGSTLNEIYGAMIQAAISENPEAAIQDDNVANDLEAELDEIEEQAKFRRDAATQQLHGPHVESDMFDTSPQDKPPTLNEIYAAWIQKSLEKNPGLMLNPGNANSDLASEVSRFKMQLRQALYRRRSMQDLQEASNVRRSQIFAARTLNAINAALIPAIVSEHGSSTLDGGNVDIVLHQEVKRYERMLQRAVKTDVCREQEQEQTGSNTKNPIIGRSVASSRTWRNGTVNWNGTSRVAPARPASSSIHVSSNNTNLGTKMFLDSTPQGSVMRLASGSTTTSNSGTIIANQSHAMLRSGKIVQKSQIKTLLVSDMTSRIFHPTQIGHAIIANLILYQIRAVVAKAAGISDFPAAVITSSGGSPPEIEGAACRTAASDTWADRDRMSSALKDFCADPHNLKASAGSSTSATFNHGSLDFVNISISWKDSADLGQHSCAAWLITVTDGCDVPESGDANWKHGGIIEYQSPTVDAVMSIEPLVVRQIWDKGKADGQQCNDVNDKHYLDQATAQANIDEYCKQSESHSGGIGDAGSKFTQIFNDGTPGRVEFTTEWPAGARNYQIFSEECRYYLSVLNDGCSLPGANNPMNWKHGGSISDKNAVRYTMTPTQHRPSPPSKANGRCKAKYRVWGYSWEVWGGGFESSNNGKELERQIRGCGAVTAWKFSYLEIPDADGTEWHASGTLPITISSHCLAKAVKSAGGFESNC